MDTPEEIALALTQQQIEAGSRADNPQAWAVADRLDPDDESRAIIVGASMQRVVDIAQAMGFDTSAVRL